MKKYLAFLMAMVLSVSFFALGAFATSAEEAAWIEPVFDSATVLEEEYGSESDEDYYLLDDVLFGDVWTFEYRDEETETFAPMEAYNEDGIPSALNGGWAQCYSASVEALWVKTPLTYCLVVNKGKQMHPSSGGSPSFTFIAPVSGTVDYSAALYATGGELNEEAGHAAYVYLNDELIWPLSNPENYYYGTNTTDKDNPLEVDLFDLEVTKGDKIRFIVSFAPQGPSGNNMFTKRPVVTYTATSDGTILGNPKGYPPEELSLTNFTSDSATFAWSAAENAVGYNIYVNDEKANSEPITGLTYTLTGLKPNSLYSVKVSSISSANMESDLSADYAFKTKKGASTNTNTDASSTDADTSDSSDTVVNSGSSATNTKPAEKNSYLLWIIIGVVALVVIAAVVVVVILLSKKKKAAATTETAETAETEETTETTEKSE